MTKALRYRILDLLESRPSDTFTSKQIALILEANNNSVRTKLGYLANTNKIWRVTKGLYQSTSAIIRQEHDPNIRLHGIKFELRCIKTMGWSYPYLKKVVTVDLKQPWLHRHSKNHSLTTSTEWEGRIITVTLHPPDKKEVTLLEVFNKSSMLPLHPIEFGAYCGFLYGIFKIPPEFWKLT